MFKILRLEQWTKNLVLFIPAVLAKNYVVLFDYVVYLIFFGFSLIVSSTYIFNDLKDVDQDINHPVKKNRPLASGELSKNFAIIYAFLLLSTGSLVLYIVNLEILTYAFLYIFLTISYSIKLKYVKYFDFLSITLLFALRLIIGGVAGEVELSNFLFFFVLFFLTQISIGKKLSIYNNKVIPTNSKVRNHLIISYKINELDKILNFTFIVSNLIFIFWSYQKLEGSLLNFLLSTLSLSLLIIFGKKFINDSKLAKTENFITWLIESRFYIISALISLLVLVITF